MAKNCTVCFNEIPDNEDTCKICGTKFEATEAPAPQAAPVVTYAAVPQQPVYAYAPVVNAQPQDPPATVGVGSFFGLNILFNLPFIGFIFVIVMSFAPKNNTLKNFARSYLIWHIIIAAIISTIAIIGILAGGDIIDFFEEILYFIEEIFEEIYYVFFW